ncbi:hypothetical protein GCM10011586_23460 [Silvibacterium dinghuense]|nr:hypothetical protein GCM10011586_23460 [Silvibacterium dinghuense]
MRDALRVDEDVDFTESVDHLGMQRLERLPLHDIAGHAQSPSPQLFYLDGHLFYLFLASGCGHNIGSCLCKADGDGVSQSGGSSYDYGYPACEVE